MRPAPDADRSCCRCRRCTARRRGPSARPERVLHAWRARRRRRRRPSRTARCRASVCTSNVPARTTRSALDSASRNARSPSAVTRQRARLGQHGLQAGPVDQRLGAGPGQDLQLARAVDRPQPVLAGLGDHDVAVPDHDVPRRRQPVGDQLARRAPVERHAPDAVGAGLADQQRRRLPDAVEAHALGLVEAVELELDLAAERRDEHAVVAGVGDRDPRRARRAVLQRDLAGERQLAGALRVDRVVELQRATPQRARGVGLVDQLLDRASKLDMMALAARRSARRARRRRSGRASATPCTA